MAGARGLGAGEERVLDVPAQAQQRVGRELGEDAGHEVPAPLAPAARGTGPREEVLLGVLLQLEVPQQGPHPAVPPAVRRWCRARPGGRRPLERLVHVVAADQHLRQPAVVQAPRARAPAVDPETAAVRRRLVGAAELGVELAADLVVRRLPVAVCALCGEVTVGISGTKMGSLFHQQALYYFINGPLYFMNAVN